MTIEIESKYLVKCLEEITKKWNERDLTGEMNWTEKDVIEILIHREAKKQGLLEDITF